MLPPQRLVILLAAFLTAAFVFLPQRNAQAEPVVTIDLYPGWNIFMYVGPTQPVADALSPINGKYSVVHSLESAQQEWESYDPSAPFLSDLQELEKFSAYMVLMTADGSLIFDAGSVPSNSLPTLHEGWNVFGYFGDTAAVGDALTSIDGRYSIVYGLNADAQQWLSYDPTAPFLSDLTQLQQFGAYVILITEGSDSEVVVIGPVPPEPPLTPDGIVEAGQDLAEATTLNGFQIAFIADATSGANASVLDSDLVEMAANTMDVAQIATTLADNLTAQNDYSENGGQPDLYYAVGRVSYALVIEAQNLRDGLASGSITSAAAAKTLAEYGTALWNPGPSPFVTPSARISTIHLCSTACKA